MAATASSILRRGLLYVPGSSQKMLEKSRGLTVDCVAYDLEDSVTPAEKPAARKAINEILHRPRAPDIREQAVRINSVGSGLALQDLQQVLRSPNLDTIIIPKVNSASDLTYITDIIRHSLPSRHPSSPSNSDNNTSHEPPIRLLALIESAKAILSLPTICAASPYLSGLIFAAEDFALDMSLTRTPSLSEFHYARSAIATAARAHDLPSTIDLVCTAYRHHHHSPDSGSSGDGGLATLERECRDGKSLGFNGKQLIHPSQVEVCQRVFGVEDGREVEWAVRVVVAGEKAESRGRGAWTLDGKMVDAPVVGRARSLLERARLCGVDVEAVRERWETQEPG